VVLGEGVAMVWKGGRGSFSHGAGFYGWWLIDIGRGRSDSYGFNSDLGGGGNYGQ
jgi:hypothetical protein